MLSEVSHDISWKSMLICGTVLEQEILLAMRLLGANKLDDLRPSMVQVKE